MLPRHAPLDMLEAAAYAGVGLIRVRAAQASGALRSINVGAGGRVPRRQSLVSWVIAWWAQGCPTRPLAEVAHTDRLAAILGSADDHVDALVEVDDDPVGGLDF